MLEQQGDRKRDKADGRFDGEVDVLRDDDEGFADGRDGNDRGECRDRDDVGRREEVGRRDRDECGHDDQNAGQRQLTGACRPSDQRADRTRSICFRRGTKRHSASPPQSVRSPHT